MHFRGACHSREGNTAWAGGIFSLLANTHLQNCQGAVSNAVTYPHKGPETAKYISTFSILD